MRLSVLDQSPVISGLGARRALEETIALARRVEELGYERYWLAEDHPFERVRLQPEVDPVPQLWLLGSSDYSGALAAELGLAFAFAHFINPRGGEEVTRNYRASFKGAKAQVIVCTFLICAQSD